MRATTDIIPEAAVVAEVASTAICHHPTKEILMWTARITGAISNTAPGLMISTTVEAVAAVEVDTIITTAEETEVNTLQFFLYFSP